MNWITWLCDFCFLSHVGRYRDIPFPSFSFSFTSPSASATSCVSTVAFSDWSVWAADSSAFSFTSVSEPASVVMVTGQPAEMERAMTTLKSYVPFLMCMLNFPFVALNWGLISFNWEIKNRSKNEELKNPTAKLNLAQTYQFFMMHNLDLSLQYLL